MKIIEPPEYTDGVLELYRIETDECNDYPHDVLKNQNMKIWYKELSLYDHMKYEMNQANVEVTLKIRIPKYKKIDSKCICLIDGRQHKVYNATHIKDKNGFDETEITLVKPEKEVEILDKK